LVATNPSVKRKGATVPYTALNDHMFSYMSKKGKLAARSARSIPEKMQRQIGRSLWRSPTRVRRSSSLVAFLYAGVKEVLRHPL
jgi:hypothetical protein